MSIDSSISANLELLVRLVGRRVHPSPDGQPPDADQLAWLLRAAAGVPDHGSLHPWRFMVVSGEARRQVGDALAADFVDVRGEAPPRVLDKLGRKAFAAPTLIIVVASPSVGSKVPEWEQVASAACCGYAIVLAAHALGLGAVWKSTALRDGPHIRSLCQLSAAEQLLGWVNVGTAPPESEIALRPIPELPSIATVLGASGPLPYQLPR
jgi:nitroreductase